MEKEKADELLKWLNEELERVLYKMQYARDRKEYTTAEHLQGEANAIQRIIKKLKNE